MAGIYMRWSILILVFPLAYSQSIVAQDLWAKGSQVLKQTDNAIEWSAPDGRASLRTNEDKGTLTIDKTVLDASDVINPGLTELHWSPNSASVFINSSDGGEVGSWFTRVFVSNGGHVREVPIGKIVANASKLHSTCKILNVMSVGWVVDGKKLLVMQQVPNSSGCSHMDATAYYVVDVQTGRIIERPTRSNVFTEYGSLFGPGTYGLTVPSLNGS